MMNVNILKIRPEDTWQIRHEVMWPDQPIEYVKLAEDEDGLHFGLFVAAGLVSIISVFEKDKEAQFRKLATVEREQGKGYGSYLLQHVMDLLVQNGVQRIWCNARKDKIRFYEQFGLKPTAQEFEKGGIQYVIMEKKLEV